MAATYSPSRPLAAREPAAPVVAKFESYAYSTQVQTLMQHMMTDLLATQPGPDNMAVIEFLEEWLAKEKKRIADGK
jgi:hypothetical protein